MPQNWNTYKLGEIADLVKDSAKPVDIQDEKYIGLEHIGQGSFRLEGIGSGDEVSSNKYRFEQGDILYGKLRPYFQKVYRPNFTGVCSTDIFVIRNKTNEINQAYLYQIIRDNRFTDKAMEANKGTRMPRADWNYLSDWEINLPPLPEQKAIAAILSALDDKIELNLQMNKTLEKMAMTLYKHWFVDFGPFQNGKFIESELGMIPEGWEVKTIYDLMDVIYGAPFKSKQFNEDGLGYPLIRIRDLKTNSPKFYTAEDHKKKTVIKAGDVLAGMDAEFDPYVWLGDEAVLNQRVVYFKPKHENVVRRYIYEAVKPWLKYFAGAKVGTTVIHLGKGDVDTFKFIFPNDKTILKEFNSQMENIHELIVNNGEQIKTLTKTRETLLPKLISGEVRVKQAEDIVKDNI